MPRTAKLSASVPPAVQTRSSGSAPMRAATRARARSRCGLGLLPEGMHARRVAEVVGKRLGHGLENRWMEGRRGVVVEIDPHDWRRS